MLTATGVVRAHAIPLPYTNRLTHHNPARIATASRASPATVRRMPQSRRAVRSVPRRDAVVHRRGQQADHRQQGGGDRHSVGGPPDLVQLREPLGERHGQQEPAEHLYAGKDDAQFLQQPVVALPQLVAVPAIVQLVQLEIMGLRRARAARRAHGVYVPTMSGGHSRPIARSLGERHGWVRHVDGITLHAAPRR